MRSSNGRDAGGVTRGRQPVVNCRANSPSLNGRFTGPVVAGDEKDQSIPPSDCFVEATVDRRPCRIKVHPVQIEHTVRCR